MMQQHTIHIAGGVVRNPLVRLTEPVTLDFLAGEHIAIVGPNGAGKSLLVDMLTGKYPLRDGELTYDFSPSLTKTAYDNTLSGAGWLKENHPRFAPVFSFAKPCTIKAKGCPASKKPKYWLHGAGHV